MRATSRTIAMAGIAAFALLATACSPGGSTPPTGAAKTGGTVSMRGCTPENELVGTNTTEVCGGNVIDMFTSKLTHYNADTAATELDIAESIESTDSQTYTVKLKKGYKFHDGTEVKAKNFVDAWNYAAYAPNGQSNASFMEAIEGYKDLQCPDEKCATKPVADKMSGLKVVDDYSFTMKLYEPTSNWKTRLGYSAFTPQPDSFFAAADKKTWAKTPVGSGPFKVTSVTATEITLDKFPEYSGKNTPKIDKVIYKIYNDTTAAYNDVVANNLDLTDTIPPDQLIGDAYKAQLKDRNGAMEVGVIDVLTFSSKDEQLNKNVKLRQAISMAMDKELINKQIFNGNRIPATGWVSPKVEGYKADICGAACHFNAADAKKMYDESGGYKGVFQISINGDGGHKPWAEAMCNQLKNNLGMDCQLNVTPDFKTLRTSIKARELKGAFRSGWQMDYPSAENFLSPIYTIKASSNDADYANPAFDAKLVEAGKAPSPEAGQKLYQDAEAMLAKDFPTMPMWYRKAAFGYSNKVDNVKLTPFQTFDMTSVTVK